MENGISVLSLFDGMSCGQIALEKAGVHVNQYYAAEIDKYAKCVTQINYPKTIQLGSVTGVSEMVLPWIDLLIGGSPCQGFSFAGKQLNFDDPRSKLFFEYVRILNELRAINPDIYFLMENVRMKKEFQDIISEHLGVQPIYIDSALVSGQTRKRLYWTNIPSIKQPADRGIMLRDVLITPGLGVVKNRGELQERNDKSLCICYSYYKGADNHAQRTMILPMEYLTDAEIERAIVKHSGKVWKSGNRMGNMAFPNNPDKKAQCLAATRIKGAREAIHVQDIKGIRMLHPIECERLQGVPDNYTDHVSRSQRYKMLGNGWNVETIAHIFSYLPYAL